MPIASPGSPKDQQMTRYYHILPKPPPLALHHPTHGQLSPSLLSLSPGTGNLFGSGATNDPRSPACQVQELGLGGLRQLSPPLTVNVTAHQESAGAGLTHMFGSHTPPTTTLLNLSPGLTSSIEHRTSPNGYDLREIPQRRSLQEIHSNVASQMAHSQMFYSGICEDTGRKSESPSRKRRRTSMSTHNVIDLTHHTPTPPPPSPRSWEMMMGDRGLNRRRSSSQRRGPPMPDPINASRNRRSPTLRRIRYRDRQSPERRAFQPPPMSPHHPLPPHLTFHPPGLPQQQQPPPQHHHHHHHSPLAANQQPQQPSPQPVVINVDQVQVSIPLTMSPHNLPLYSSPHPIPVCTNPHLPPCGMQTMHNCNNIQFSNCQQVPHLVGCGSIHLSHHHHHHHHHMYPPVMHGPHPHQQSPPNPGQPHLLQPQFMPQQPLAAQSQDGDLEVLGDHRPAGFPGMPPPPPGLHPGPSLPPTPSLHLIQDSPVRSGQADAHFSTLCSYVPHARRLSVNRRVTGRRWRTPLPTSPASYPGFLLHFFAMFSNPSLPTYSQEMVNPENAEAENYEALLNLAERLGEAKPRGLLKTEIDQLPSYRFNAETHQSDQTSCVICMCDFEQRQLLRVLPCNHEFHAKCVDKWLKTNRTCPICRGDASEYFNHSE